MIRIVCVLASGGFYPRRLGGSQGHEASGSFRVGLACVLMIGVVMGSHVVADDGLPDQTEPPVRLKKKVKPQAEAPTEQRPKEPTPKKAEPSAKSGEPKEDGEPNIQD